ncbi:universal stress protein [Dyella sp. GSA-30]|uniref:universal stress protein n=1 Tax=Dyella sp. GSA-30 TaxID=2994496 RepID=UPI00248F7011|nr:universal stress protein [Dyella sp. GSA-30]BDU18734.1 universal stress protein UspA [Dyella sp. GSA-30]
MFKYSLVGYDSSPSSQRAFCFAIKLARLSQGRVRVVSALQIIEGGVDTTSLVMTDTSGQRAVELMAELRALAPDADTLVDLEVLHGSPGDILICQVHAHSIDHIVIGHTERGALARWLVGSVSDDVLARAHVPVTVVR